LPRLSTTGANGIYKTTTKIKANIYGTMQQEIEPHGD